MMNGLKPYPATKDSRVKWLGEVPTHWNIQRLRTIAEMRVSNVDKHSKEDETPVRLCNYVHVYKNDQIRSGMDFMPATATIDEIERFRLHAGDVLITKDSEAWNDIGVPALVRDIENDVISGYHLALLRPETSRVEGDYLLRAIQSLPIAYQFHVRANGVTRFGLSHEAIKSTWIPVPPATEQTAIADFLGYADRRIQRFIRAKEKLIALLEEQRLAIAHEATTGQIDVRTGQRYPTYKSSGVGWVAEVPEHWGTIRLKNVLSGPTQNGLFKKQEHFGNGVPLINVKDVYAADLYIEPESLERVRASPQEIRRFKVESSDIFFVRSSLKLEGTGRSAIATNCSPDTVFECHLVQARPNANRVNARYLVIQANSPRFHHHLVSRANAVTMATIPQNTITSCRLCLPPSAEQQEIVQWIDTQWNLMDRAIENVNGEVALVRKFQARLIADVVTGKVDIRDMKTTLLQMQT